MISSSRRSGFTLIELMIVVAIIAIIAGIAIPRLMSARLAANEAAAISTLRSVSSAEAQLQSSGAIDTDADGAGEFGYLAELAGSVPMRVAAGIPAAPAAGAVTDILNPAILSSAFGNVTNSIVSRQGYYFQLWLPSATNLAGLTPGIAEDPTGGKLGPPFPDPNAGEVMWCAYAWPLDRGRTGNRAFFVNQRGDLLQCLNRSGVVLSNTTSTPTFDDAYATVGDMGSAVRVGIANAAGHIWLPMN